MNARLFLVFVAGCSQVPDPKTDLVKPPVEIAVGNHPIDLATGDLDGDGALDLVTANATARTISARLHHKTWEATAELAVDGQPHMIALGDLDGDRDLDIVASAHDSGVVWVLHNDSKGAFSAARSHSAVTVAKPHNHGLVIGDVDHDGLADVIVADQTGRLVSVLRADRSGTLATAVTVDLGGQPYPPALGDLDNDGDLDLVAPLLDRHAVAVLLNNGRGAFTPAPYSPVRVARERPYAIALADLDGNTKLDMIVVHDDTNDMSVMLDNGPAGFRPAPGSPISANRRLWRITTADIDRDGALDLVGSGSGSLVLMRGKGSGRFEPPRIEPSGGWIAITADLDADGFLDIAAPQPTENVIRVWSTR